jgi:hemerythrin-like domain-containing protein
VYAKPLVVFKSLLLGIRVTWFSCRPHGYGARDDISEASAGGSAMPDVFEILGADHADVKGMLTVLAESPDHTDQDEAVQAARQDVVDYLVMDSSRHEAAEEQHFWPAVRERIENGNELADKAISQETKAKEILAKLDKLSSREKEFDELLVQFIPAARQHIAFEETRVWPSLRQALSTAESQELGEKIQKAEKKGPTRPHPHTPASPGLQKAAGPAVAVIDRLRDAMTGRGRTD